MRNLLTFMILLLLHQQVSSQTFHASNVYLKTLEGSSIQINEILTSSTGTILIFWESNSTKCINNLDNLQEEWAEEVKALGVDLIAICVNQTGTLSMVKPYVSGKGWDFKTYIDINGDLKRVLGITTTPYTILLDGNQNIKCQYPGYCSGDEILVCNKIIDCLENTEIQINSK